MFTRRGDRARRTMRVVERPQGCCCAGIHEEEGQVSRDAGRDGGKARQGRRQGGVQVGERSQIAAHANRLGQVCKAKRAVAGSRRGRAVVKGRDEEAIKMGIYAKSREHGRDRLEVEIVQGDMLRVARSLGRVRNDSDAVGLDTVQVVVERARGIRAEHRRAGPRAHDP